MNTRINTAHGSEVVTDHREPIPLKPDGTVDYYGYFKEEKIEVKRNLCQIF